MGRLGRTGLVCSSILSAWDALPKDVDSSGWTVRGDSGFYRCANPGDAGIASVPTSPCNGLNHAASLPVRRHEPPPIPECLGGRAAR